MRHLKVSEFEAIHEKYIEAMESVNRDEKLSRLANEVEQDLILLGCSAVEDSLQDKVPETITRLLEANIKVWMITGDKLETAENIAASAGIINVEMKRY
jgi:phospholipid-transporting ATPase